MPQPAYYPTGQMIMVITALAALGVMVLKIIRHRHHWRVWLPAVLVIVHTFVYYYALLTSYAQIAPAAREEWSYILRIHALVTLLIYALFMPIKSSLHE